MPDAASPDTGLPGTRILRSLGPIRQFAYVVARERLDDEVGQWLDRGVGPWIFMREVRQQGYVHRGVEVAPVLSLGFANSGDMQIELITTHDDTPSPFSEFLGARSEGFHHHAWWTDDFDAWTARADGAGWTPLAHGDGGGMARWVYYDVGGPGLVEVMELTDATKWMTGHVRDAHVAWDGATDPVRSLF